MSGIGSGTYDLGGKSSTSAPSGEIVSIATVGWDLLVQLILMEDGSRFSVEGRAVAMVFTDSDGGYLTTLAVWRPEYPPSEAERAATLERAKDLLPTWAYEQVEVLT